MVVEYCVRGQLYTEVKVAGRIVVIQSAAPVKVHVLDDVADVPSEEEINRWLVAHGERVAV